ncbi:MAG: hypothetical protein WCX22_07765 [Methanoregula sp.]
MNVTDLQVLLRGSGGGLGGFCLRFDPVSSANHATLNFSDIEEVPHMGVGAGFLVHDLTWHFEEVVARLLFREAVETIDNDPIMGHPKV